MSVPPAPRPSTSQSGFTRSDLLAVVALTMLALCLALPLRAKTSQNSAQAQCAANLRQFAAALHLYAADNFQRFPSTAFESASWPDDLPSQYVQLLILYGMQPTTFFCPLNRPETISNPTLPHFTFGYAAAFLGTWVSPTNRVSRLIPTRITFEGGVHPPPAASERVLLADITVTSTLERPSVEPERYFRPKTQGGSVLTVVHRTGIEPAGGNVAMLDGHVEWRTFEAMTARSSPSPYFWW